MKIPEDVVEFLAAGCSVVIAVFSRDWHLLAFFGDMAALKPFLDLSGLERNLRSKATNCDAKV